MQRPNDLPVQTVRPDSYLTLHYRLSDDEGNEFVSTFDLSPATLQMGSGQLAAPLENCLVGMPVQQRRVFQLDSSEAFGEHNPKLVERIARSALPADVELKENSLIELSDTTALFDFNHPLAGKPIRFEVEVIGIM